MLVQVNKTTRVTISIGQEVFSLKVCLEKICVKWYSIKCLVNTHRKLGNIHLIYSCLPVIVVSLHQCWCIPCFQIGFIILIGKYFCFFVLFNQLAVLCSCIFLCNLCHQNTANVIIYKGM